MEDFIEKKKTMNNRTYLEQNHVEKLILSFYDRYYSKAFQNEKFEDEQQEHEEEEDLKDAISHFILKPFHAQFLYSSLRSTGTFCRIKDC